MIELGPMKKKIEQTLELKKQSLLLKKILLLLIYFSKKIHQKMIKN